MTQVVGKSRKYQFGSRWRSGSVVIRPARSWRDMSTGVHQFEKGLRVKVKDHKADLDVQAKEDRWSEDDILFAQNYLDTHPDFGRSDGRGIFHSTEATIVTPKTQAELEAQLIEAGRTLQRRCIFKQDMGDDIIQCENPVVADEADFCETHQALIAAS